MAGKSSLSRRVAVSRMSGYNVWVEALLLAHAAGAGRRKGCPLGPADGCAVSTRVQGSCLMPLLGLGTRVCQRANAKPRHRGLMWLWCGCAVAPRLRRCGRGVVMVV